MAFGLRWLRAAVEDLDAIAAYIATDSPAYASAMVHRVLEMARSLPDFPKSGRVVPEWNQMDVPERTVYPYRLIYRLQGKSIIVLAVIHGARLLPEELQDREE